LGQKPQKTGRVACHPLPIIVAGVSKKSYFSRADEKSEKLAKLPEIPAIELNVTLAYGECRHTRRRRVEIPDRQVVPELKFAGVWHVGFPDGRPA